MRVHRCTARAVGNPPESLWVADLGVHDVLPQQHSRRALDRASDAHPGRHFRHGSGIEHLGSVRRYQLVDDRRDRRTRLAREDQSLQAELARRPAPLLRYIRQVQRVGRSPVEHRGPDLGQPACRTRTHPRCAGSEWESSRAQALGAGQRPPASQIEAEDRRQEHGVARANAHAPHHARVRIRDRLPVAAADGERGGTPGCTGRAVDMEDLGLAERRGTRRRQALSLAIRAGRAW